jgi:hypothetical protein
LRRSSGSEFGRHQLRTYFRVPSPLRLVKDDDVFRRLRTIGMLFEIAKQVLDHGVSLILRFCL